MKGKCCRACARVDANVQLPLLLLLTPSNFKSRDSALIFSPPALRTSGKTGESQASSATSLLLPQQCLLLSLPSIHSFGKTAEHTNVITPSSSACNHNYAMGPGRGLSGDILSSFLSLTIAKCLTLWLGCQAGGVKPCDFHQSSIKNLKANSNWNPVIRCDPRVCTEYNKDKRPLQSKVYFQSRLHSYLRRLPCHSSLTDCNTFFSTARGRHTAPTQRKECSLAMVIKPTFEVSFAFRLWDTSIDRFTLLKLPQLFPL